MAEWWGVDPELLGLADKGAVRSMSDVLPGVLRGLKLDQRRIESEILKVWNHLIDPAVVAHARPTGLHKGTLFVSVDSSVWLAEIVRYHRAEILARLQHSFGSDLIKKLSFRVG
ncbi:MAG: DUF721 domain-containing protein [Verrucomicrobiae bacterium]|nr:DUF721 domain-containing protein [Verrucomicrobiae bacterium]